MTAKTDILFPAIRFSYSTLSTCTQDKAIHLSAIMTECAFLFNRTTKTIYILCGSFPLKAGVYHLYNVFFRYLSIALQRCSPSVFCIHDSCPGQPSIACLSSHFLVISTWRTKVRYYPPPRNSYLFKGAKYVDA